MCQPIISPILRDVKSPNTSESVSTIVVIPTGLCGFDMPGSTRPVEKVAQAVAKCSTEASAYGKCIVTDYNSVYKDRCLTEFLRLKNCYLAAAKRK